MSANERRFQSGREVFETYIPDYGSTINVAETGSESAAGAALAEELLKDFRDRLARVSLPKKRTKRAKGPRR